jgi:hypothetical protein
MKPLRNVLGLGVLVLLACTLVACDTGSEPAPSAQEDTQAEEGAPGVPETGDGEQPHVLMMGRSVMRGWFDHWGWDGDGALEREGRVFEYAELASPPDIASSAADYIEQAPEGSVVFFKLCFVDFEAYSNQDIDARVDENVGYVRDVAAAAAKRDMVLIIGNALPRVRGETSAELRKLHRRYNDELEALAAGEADVYVLDLYGTLATANGALDARFAISPEDSHLAESAYEELDAQLFALLDEIED